MKAIQCFKSFPVKDAHAAPTSYTPAFAVANPFFAPVSYANVCFGIGTTV